MHSTRHGLYARSPHNTPLLKKKHVETFGQACEILGEYSLVREQNWTLWMPSCTPCLEDKWHCTSSQQWSLEVGTSWCGAAFQHTVLANFTQLKEGWMEKCTETFLIKICCHLPGWWTWNEGGHFSKTMNSQGNSQLVSEEENKAARITWLESNWKSMERTEDQSS